MRGVSRNLKEFFGEDFDDVELALLYGSKKDSSDKDILVILNTDEKVQKRGASDEFDLSLAKKKEFESRLALWDIEYTQPILTGEYICGNKKSFKRYRNYLEENRPDERALHYLKLRSIETLNSARMRRDKGLSDIFNIMHQMGGSAAEISSVMLLEKDVCIRAFMLYDSVHHLSYSLSYLAAWKRYQDFDGPVTLEEMLDSPQNDIEEKLAELKALHKSNKKLTLPLIKMLFSDTEELIRKYIGGG